MKHKLSPWHDGSVKPVHDGVYESCMKGYYRKFSNGIWYWASTDIELASASTTPSGLQDGRWRGIIK